MRTLTASGMAVTLLWFCCTLALAAETQSTPLEWASMGMRVTPREVTLATGQSVLPVVDAVQADGPAFHAGIQRGDAVTFVGCGRWSHDFAPQTGNRWTYHQYYAELGAEAQRGQTELKVSQMCLAGYAATISVAIPRNDPRRFAKLLELRMSAGNGGAWRDSSQGLAASVASDHADGKSRLESLRRQALGELRTSPCSYDVRNPYNLRTMPPIVNQIVRLRAELGMGEENMSYWADVITTYCEESRDGGALPSFEAAMLRISRGELDPCAYDEQQNYSAFGEDPQSLARRYSRTEYNRTINFEYFLKKLATPAKQQCFFDLIRHRIGRP